jgi:hypothetical protein
VRVERVDPAGPAAALRLQTGDLDRRHRRARGRLDRDLDQR